MSVPMTGSGGIAKKPNLKALISSFYPLQQQQSGENGVKKKGVIRLGENRQQVHSCGQPAENPQSLKMKHVVSWVFECSVQHVTHSSLAEEPDPHPFLAASFLFSGSSQCEREEVSLYSRVTI